MVLSLPADRGPHIIIRHEDAKLLWAKKCHGLEKVDREYFAYALLDAMEDGLVPSAAPALDEGGCIVGPGWHI
jgi:hypothetical protein